MKKVKSLSIYKVENPEDDIQNGYLSAYTKYDENANVIEDVIFENARNIESKTLAKYDEKHRLIEEINYISEDEIAEKLYYTYNEKGNLETITINYGDGSTSVKSFDYSKSNEVVINITDEDNEYEGQEIRKYNDDDKLVEKTIYDDLEKLDEKETIEYNEKNEVIKRTEYNTDNEIEAIINYEYDEQGNLTKFLKLSSNNEVIDKVLFKYNENGKLVQQLTGDYYVTKISYDDENKIKVEERYDMNGFLQFRMESRFDEEERLIEEITPLYTNKYVYEFYA